VHPQTPVTPPPPQLWPVPAQVVKHCTMRPQLFAVGPHLPPPHVVVMGSSVHVLQSPEAIAQPYWHGVSEPHWPFAPHVCAVVLLHRCVPGTQTPPHLPVAASQMFVHALGAT
jgi:hypothetical protein